jgi:hypothetical protein
MGENAASSTTCPAPAGRFRAWTSRTTICGGCVGRSRARASRICLPRSLSARTAKTPWLASKPRLLRHESANFSRSSTLESGALTVALSLAHLRRSCLWTSSSSCKGGARSAGRPHLMRVDPAKNQRHSIRRWRGQATARISQGRTSHRGQRADDPDRGELASRRALPRSEVASHLAKYLASGRAEELPGSGPASRTRLI